MLSVKTIVDELLERHDTYAQNLATDYELPANYRQRMYDFYAISNAFAQMPGFPPNKGIEHDTNLLYAWDAIRRKMYPQLKKELLGDVFLAVAAEVRHVFEQNSIEHMIKNSRGGNEMSALQVLLKYMAPWMKGEKPNFFAGKTAPAVDLDKAPIDMPKGHTSKYETARDITMGGCLAMGVDLGVFCDGCAHFFDTKVFTWTRGFGGDRWMNIARAYRKLEETPDTNLDRLMAEIDIVFDLQHNTGSVLTKSKRWRDSNGTHEWIKRVLDQKANSKYYYDIIDQTSPVVKAFMWRLQQDYFGVSEEMAHDPDFRAKHEEKDKKPVAKPTGSNPKAPPVTTTPKPDVVKQEVDKLVGDGDKYELGPVESSGELSGYRRIKALVVLPKLHVKVGDFGGYVEGTWNLSQEGQCWISGDASVGNSAIVTEEAWVRDEARVRGNAEIFGNCLIADEALVDGKARIGGDAIVMESAHVTGTAFIAGEVVVKMGITVGQGSYLSMDKFQKEVVNKADVDDSEPEPQESVVQSVIQDLLT